MSIEQNILQEISELENEKRYIEDARRLEFHQLRIDKLYKQLENLEPQDCTHYGADGYATSWRGM